MRIGVETIIFNLRVLDQMVAKWYVDLRMMEANHFSYMRWQVQIAHDVALLHVMFACVLRLTLTEVLQYVIGAFVLSGIVFNFFVAGMAFHRIYVGGPPVGWTWPGAGLSWCFTAIWMSRSWWEVWRNKLMGVD